MGDLIRPKLGSVQSCLPGAAKLVPPPVKPASSAAPGALRGREPCARCCAAGAGDTFVAHWSQRLPHAVAVGNAQRALRHHDRQHAEARQVSAERAALHARARLREGRRRGVNGRPNRLDRGWVVGDRGMGTTE